MNAKRTVLFPLPSNGSALALASAGTVQQWDRPPPGWPEEIPSESIHVAFPTRPEDARRILETRNRGNWRKSMSNIYVVRFAREMEAGRWRTTTCQPIRFNPEGGLVDGQHRLAALATLAKPVMLEYQFGFDDDDVGALDQGRRRDGVQFLAAAGHERAKIAQSALNLLHLYEQGKLDHLVSPLVTLSPEELVQMAGERPQLIGFTKDLAPFKFLRSDAATVVARYLTHAADRTLAESFWERLKDQTYLTHGDPELTLINLFTRGTYAVLGRRKVLAPAALAMILKTWAARVAGREIKVLRYDPTNEGFPYLDPKPAGKKGR